MKKNISFFFFFILLFAFAEEQPAEPLNRFLDGIRNIKDQDFNEFKEYILDYYSGVTPLKSIKTTNGVIDCIPFEQQYSVRTLPEKERLATIALYNKYNRQDNKSSEKKSICPAGYVPIPRITPTILSDIDAWDKNQSAGTAVTDQNNNKDEKEPADNTKSEAPHGGTSFSSTPEYVYYWCTSESRQYDMPPELKSHGHYIPGSYIGLNFPAIPLNNSLDMGLASGEEHSLFQLWISNKESGDPFPEDFSCLECGYKYETGLQDPVIFCYATVTGYRESEWSGYNACGKYFIMTSNRFNFDHGVAGFPLRMGFYFDNERGWIFVVNGEEAGYYRKSLFKDKMDSMDNLYIMYGGEVCQSKENKNTVLMGNGRSNIFGTKLSTFFGYYVTDPLKIPASIKKMYDPDKVFINDEIIPVFYMSNENSSSTSPEVYKAIPYKFSRSPVPETGLIIGGGLPEE